MAFEKGGYADKLGNRFETRWVVLQYLHVLSGELVSVYHEPVGADEEGVDLWVVNNKGLKEAQQCKGELGAKSAWSMADLHAKGILDNLRNQLQRNDVHRFGLVSATPATMLRDLSRSARDSTGDPQSFYRDQIQKRSKDHRAAFADFCKYLNLDPANAADLAIAFDLLRRSDFHPYADDHDTRRTLKTLAGLLVDGNPDNVLSVLAEFSSENLRKTIYADDLLKHLRSKGFHAKDLAHDDRLVPCVEELRRQFDASMRRHLAAGRLIPRNETQEAIKWLETSDSNNSILLIHGRAGAGKSGVLLELIDHLETNGVPYLPLRLDRQTPLGNLRKYGESMGLPESPVACLRALAVKRPSVLILDQLDALRWTCSHAASALPICEEMLHQAMATQNMKVVVTCRTFDLTQDPQLKSWNRQTATSIEVGPLSREVVREFVSDCGHNCDALSPREMTLLSSIHNLTMWAELAQGSAMPQFQTATHLTRLFWDSRQKALAERDVLWQDAERVLNTLTEHMERTGQLSAPKHLVEMHSRELAELQSLNVILVEAGRVSFCHQAYFDYLVARSLLSEIDRDSSSLMNWLGVPSRGTVARWIGYLARRLPFRLSGKRIRQSLFCREQLRLVLAFLRDDEPERFLAAVKVLITDQRVRFHLKHLALQVLAQATDPRVEEVDWAISLLSDDTWRAHFIEQLVHADRSWFLALHERGVWAEWLESADEELVNHALWAFRFSNAKCGDEIADLLRPYISAAGNWPKQCVQSLPRRAEEESDALFQLRLSLCEKGVFDPWVDWEGHAKRRPEGLVELLAVHVRQLSQGISSGDEDDRGTRSALESLRHMRDDDRNEIVGIGRTCPLAVWEKLFPYVLQFVTTRHHEIQRRGRVGQHSYNTIPRLSSIVGHILIVAGRSLIQTDRDAFCRMVDGLGLKVPRSIERIILYSLLGADSSGADDVVKWLTAKPSRLRLGSRLSRSPWEPARRLIREFAPHCSEPAYQQLEQLVLSHHDKEERNSIKRKYEEAKQGRYYPNLFGQMQFHLLPALPDVRKSLTAKGLEGVFERKFAGHAQHLWPQDRRTKAGFVGSSIPRERLPRISDNAWLRLITTNLPRRRFFPREIKDGGFRESSVEMFARDLEVMTRREPSRFARLALKIPASADPTFVDHILRGLEQDSPPDDLSDDEKQLWNPATAGELEDVIRRAHLKIRTEHAATFCQLVQRHAEADWSNDVINHVIAIAESHEHPKPGEYVVQMENQDSSQMLETNSINVTRGVAAGTVEMLLWKHPDWIDRLAPAIDSLVADPHPAVRVAGIGACLPVLNIDRDRAMSWLVRACSHEDDRILACHNTCQFLAYSAHTHLTGIEPILKRMVHSRFADVHKWGAAHVAACWLMHDSLKSLLKYCWRGTNEMRIGVAMAACELLGDPRCSLRCRRLLKSYFSDSHDEVRHQCNRLFYEHDLSCFEGNAKFLKNYVATAAFRDDPSALLHALEAYTGSLVPLANVVFKVCDVFAGPLAEASRDISTSFAGDARQIAPLLLRLYGQAADPGNDRILEKCLDSWDALLRNRVGSIATMMQKFAS